MVDDFHGTQEWNVFTTSMQRVFPDRAIVELSSNDPIFHTVYDLDERFQVPGAQYFRTRDGPTRKTATSLAGAESTTTRAA